jgi:hypothetical protein
LAHSKSNNRTHINNNNGVALFQNIKRVLVSRWNSFKPQSLSWLPTTVTCLDFDGELFYRGRVSPALDFPSTVGLKGWLPEAEAILK